MGTKKKTERAHAAPAGSDTESEVNSKNPQTDVSSSSPPSSSPSASEANHSESLTNLTSPIKTDSTNQRDDISDSAESALLESTSIQSDSNESGSVASIDSADAQTDSSKFPDKPPVMVDFSPQELLLIEAILFAAGTRISVQRIMELSKISDRPKVETILRQLAQKHSGDHSAFDLMHMGEDWKMTVKKPFLSVAEKIAPDAELPKSIVETLAILAWKAPMTQSDLVKIRSNKAYDHIEELQTRGFINRERRGRTYVLKLTPKFFEYFDVQGKKQVEKLFERFQSREDIVAQKQLTEFEKQKQLQQQKEAAAQQTLATLGQEPAADTVTIKKIKDENRAKQREFFDDIESRLNKIVSKTTSVKDAIAEIAKSDTVAAMNAETGQTGQESSAQQPDANKSDADESVSESSATDTAEQHVDAAESQTETGNENNPSK